MQLPVDMEIANTQEDDSLSSFDQLPSMGNGMDLTGENDFDQTIVGLRYYFGAEKSLKRRFREDDPRSTLLDSLPKNKKPVVFNVPV